MDYKIILTDPAREQFEQIIYYILYKLGNKQAANNVIRDAEEAKLRLSHLAGSIKMCEDDHLRALGYRTIHFKRHKYFMLYRIEGSVVYVDGIYHDLQDYENLTR